MGGRGGLGRTRPPGPLTVSPPADPLGYDAVMVFGGAMHTDQDDLHPWLIPEKALLRDLLAAGVAVGVAAGSAGSHTGSG